VAEGERVELVFINQTSMSHPMHLDGRHFQVAEIDGDRFPGAARDTILLVAPGRREVVAFDADAPGRWRAIATCSISRRACSPPRYV
jgi:FtsP/CotA-like multicopper oxidase with cupredoxin domain